MPRPKKGYLSVGAADKSPHVVLAVPEPGDILFTSEQARDLARKLIQKAEEIDNREARVH